MNIFAGPLYRRHQGNPKDNYQTGCHARDEENNAAILSNGVFTCRFL